MRLAAVLLVVLLAGCASTEPPVSPSPTPSGPLPAELLSGEKWVLLDAVRDPDTPQFAVSLQFEDGQVSGRAPVNTYAGPVRVTGDSLSFGALASTKMAGPPAAMAAESSYFQSLAEITGWTVADDLLTLSGDDGPLLVYAAPGSTGAFAVTLLGQRREEAKAAAIAAGYEYRVISVDGDNRAVTLDYRPDRVNASIVDGRVTRVSVG
jgi:heat shock protein HslJ